MRKIKFLLFFILLLWNFGNFIKIIPLPQSELTIYFYLFFNKLFSFVCHQDHEKLINILGNSTLLCSRCTGIYFGAFFISLYSVITTIKLKIKIDYLLISSIPMFLDIILVLFGIYNYSKIIAFSSGFILGSVGFAFILDLIFELIDKRRSV